MKSLEVVLRDVRQSGRQALVPYFVAGATPDWTRYVEAAALGGADAIEIGIPFSDPMIDGVVIQEATLNALNHGTTLESICQELESLKSEVPLIAMTYYNIVLHYGLDRAAGRLRDAGISGAIVPDLPLEESSDWRAACDHSDVATIYLVAPSTPAPRAHEIVQRTQGFAYASARMAVTGAASDDGDGARVVATLREASDVPIYVGIGITTPKQAAKAASYSDGVIVGSALVKLMLDGATTTDVERFVASFRIAID
ncbi:MAG TPA: tryptophan synthase subunit alpha [Acidimicrobiales bacterium]|nr:tryptophan synthase subunit alpha [Acidimicrobiales bacterium]